MNFMLFEKKIFIKIYCFFFILFNIVYGFFSGRYCWLYELFLDFNYFKFYLSVWLCKYWKIYNFVVEYYDLGFI